MKTTPKKTKVAVAAPSTETTIKVTLPPTFAARVNQMAHRKGKAVADLWRISTMTALQNMANEGAPLDELSTALAGIERDTVPEQAAEVAAAMSQITGDKP
jgi:hypothetical protein